MHTPATWDPRLDQPVTITREELDSLMGGRDEMMLHWLTAALYVRIKRIEYSKLPMLEKIARSLPLEEMVLKLITIRRVLALCQEAADLLDSLEKEDADDQARRLSLSWARPPADPPPS